MQKLSKNFFQTKIKNMKDEEKKKIFFFLCVYVTYTYIHVSINGRRTKISRNCK